MLLSRGGEAKLADVGLARVLKGGDYTQSAETGTWAYASPEVVRPGTGKACATVNLGRLKHAAYCGFDTILLLRLRVQVAVPCARVCCGS